MRFIGTVFFLLAVMLPLHGCGPKPPVDSQGKTPQQVLMETYTLILEGQYARAQKNFSPRFIEDLITRNNSTFIEYCRKTQGWRADWLRAKLIDNDYNDNLWRVQLFPDNGKSEENRSGIVHDLTIVDGRWTIVFWGHYSKS